MSLDLSNLPPLPVYSLKDFVYWDEGNEPTPDGLAIYQMIERNAPKHFGFLRALTGKPAMSVTQVFKSNTLVHPSALGPDTYSISNFEYFDGKFSMVENGKWRLVWAICDGILFYHCGYRGDSPNCDYGFDDRMDPYAWYVNCEACGPLPYDLPCVPAPKLVSFTMAVKSFVDARFPGTVGYVSCTDDAVKVTLSNYSCNVTKDDDIARAFAALYRAVVDIKDTGNVFEKDSVLTEASINKSPYQCVKEAIKLENVRIKFESDYYLIEMKLGGSLIRVKSQDVLTAKALFISHLYEKISPDHFWKVDSFSQHVWRANPIPYWTDLDDDTPSAHVMNWLETVWTSMPPHLRGLLDDEFHRKVRCSVKLLFMMISDGYINLGAELRKIEEDKKDTSPWSNLLNYLKSKKHSVLKYRDGITAQRDFLYYREINYGTISQPVWYVDIWYNGHHIKYADFSLKKAADSAAFVLLGLLRQNDTGLSLFF
jgi:hypothetical protein